LISQKRQAGIPLLDLTSSNPTIVSLDYPHDAIRQAFSQVRSFDYEPDPVGSTEARLAIVSYYGRRGVRVTPEQILLTASTSEAYSLLFKLFCNPGDEVLAPLPSYPLFEYLSALESVRIVPYWLRYDGSWFIDFADLKRQISPRTRALVVVNPNNPTGSYLKRAEAEELLALARQHDLPVIADEVFMDYAVGTAGGRVKTFIGRDTTLSFSLNGLSKAAGMPQMKLGWIVINGPEADRQMARERLELLLDTYLSVNTPVQRALPQLLEIGQNIQQQIVERTSANFLFLTQILEGSPGHCLHLEGGWSAVVQLPATTSEEAWITRLVEECSVIAQPGYFFDMPSEAYIVVSLITPPDIFHEGINRLNQLQRNP
jgi:aspartate/methionine/tyrosine aminotransferase